MRKAEIYLEYQNLLSGPPISPLDMYRGATTSDESTVSHWQHIWLGNITANKQRFGSFADYSVGSEYQKYKYQPCIVVGSGPSLKNNAPELKKRGKIPLVSCLHNFHYMEDLGIAPEYYISLDAGTISESGSGVMNIIEEIYEGGTRSPEEYWKVSADRTLVAFIGTNPELLRLWRGKILLFNAPLPTRELVDKIATIENFGVSLSSGGNVLGAALYFSKGILGCHQSILVGADCSFGYDRKFYGWDSKYDRTMGQTMRVTDIFGNSVHTWASYWGFKQYFDSVSMRVPGIYYNCSEGGCVGAYPGGNLPSFRYMDLKDCLSEFNLSDQLSDTISDVTTVPRKILYS